MRHPWLPSSCFNILSQSTTHPTGHQGTQLPLGKRLIHASLSPSGQGVAEIRLPGVLGGSHIVTSPRGWCWGWGQGWGWAAGAGKWALIIWGQLAFLAFVVILLEIR